LINWFDLCVKFTFTVLCIDWLSVDLLMMLQENIITIMANFTVTRVESAPIEGQKPGTSGLRKKVQFYFSFYSYTSVTFFFLKSKLLHLLMMHVYNVICIRVRLSCVDLYICDCLNLCASIRFVWMLLFFSGFGYG
jgi:hypothetical protein